MISIENLCLMRGPKTLIDSSSLVVYPKQKVGFIGKNGSGKSSFFSFLLNQLEATSGEHYVPTNWSICIVKQEAANSTKSAIDYVISGDEEYSLLQKKLIEAEKNSNGMEISKLHEKIENINGYSIEGRASKILKGLGFQEKQLQNKVNDFSGGWKVRLNLAKSLIKEYDLLLLDEPTNHLDLEAILWLEDWLKNIQSTIVVIAHDRSFLDNITTHTLSLENKQLTLYTGNYSQYVKTKTEKIRLLEKLSEKQQAQRERLQKFIDRFKAKATKAKQAQSRVKMLNKMEEISTIQIDSNIYIEFKNCKPCSNPIIKLENIDFSYGENQILNKINLSLDDESRIGLLGLNGQGKSTLIKCITKNLEINSGEITTAKNLNIGYFAQHQVELLNYKDNSLSHFLTVNANVSEQTALNYLGSFGFSKDDTIREISSLSGGEKSKLVLACIIWQEPNLLLLDEPTNHLDLETKEALQIALQNYKGAMILISHDRSFIETTCDELLLLHDKKLTPFKGTLEEYQTWVSSQTTKEEIKKEKNNSYLEKKQQKSLLLKLEKQIEKTSTEIDKISKELENPKLYETQDFAKVNQLQSTKQELEEKLLHLEEEWLQNSD